MGWNEYYMFTFLVSRCFRTKPGDSNLSERFMEAVSEMALLGFMPALVNYTIQNLAVLNFGAKGLMALMPIYDKSTRMSLMREGDALPRS